MDNINKIIVLLQAFLNTCKDFHYGCTSYSRHLLADTVADDELYDIIDSMKENLFLAKGELPLPSKVYTASAAAATPNMFNTDREGLMHISLIAHEIDVLVNATQVSSRTANALLDSIAEIISKAEALVNIEFKGATAVSEADDASIVEEVKAGINEAMKILHDHKAATETPVDRKEIKAIYPDGEKVAKRVLDYEAQNVLVAESSDLDTLDRVSKKLGL